METAFNDPMLTSTFSAIEPDSPILINIKNAPS